MKVEQFKNDRGVPVRNQFIIRDGAHTYFQSYETVIAYVYDGELGREVTLDKNKWNCSKTTSKYRAQFLGEDTKTTQNKIDSGEYVLANLN